MHDFDKYNDAREKTVGDTGQFWNNVEPEKVESFLSVYFNKTIRLLAIEQETNIAYGNTVWAFAYREADTPEEEPEI